MSTYNVPDDPRRVAGPGELSDDYPDYHKDPMDSYKASLEADDAERVYRGNLMQDCDSAMGVNKQLTELFTDFNSVFGVVK